MAPGCKLSITAEKEGYVKTTRTITAANTATSYSYDIELNPVSNAAPAIAAGSVIVLENIYYDFNKSSIRTGAARELDGLVDLMQRYPSMEIELLSHTDSRGGTRYNMQLSKKRAASAKRYIVSRGIDSQRITAIGKGETEPRNHCTDGKKCSEAEFEYNRRTEVKIVRIDPSVTVRYRN
ncbi:MAG: OmpA family protein [Bacteroidota bacterium]